MGIISLTKLYDLLTAKLGKETAENLTSYIEEKIKTGISERAENLATKQDLAQTRVDLIKWIFAFWITLVLLIIGLYLALLKEIMHLG